MKILVIGAGLIGQEYARILHDLKVDFVNLCKSKESGSVFREKTGFEAIHGGLDQNRNILIEFTHFIVACDVESAYSITTILFEHNCKNILLEKPGTLSIEQFSNLYSRFPGLELSVYIAYNRRNYSSVLKAMELAKEDEGIISAYFDFTEWSHVIEKSNKSDILLKNWFFGNSTHVIDTVFFMIGKPEKLQPISMSKLSWHKPSVFVGSGISKNNVPFSYHSNWQSAGRWNIEIKTKKRALRLMPMEQLFEQKIGSLLWDEIKIANEKDSAFKPGFYQQVYEFLFVENPNLKTFREQFEDLTVYSKILGKIG